MFVLFPYETSWLQHDENVDQKATSTRPLGAPRGDTKETYLNEVLIGSFVTSLAPCTKICRDPRCVSNGELGMDLLDGLS